ncbi:MAG: hypothetical protein ACRDYD_02135 [Acidimicrobiales bacterium]
MLRRRPARHRHRVPARFAIRASRPDEGTYADVRDPAVDLVVVVAAACAASEGWRP